MYRSSSHQQRLKFKKKVKINSLEAAICNVALFKSMKDKQFRDTIFISYGEDGVILQAVSQQQWKNAHDHILSFLNNKKIALLTYGYDRDQYQALISKGLKEITRRIKEKDEQCPYINIIHYQKLRKSCEYMDKERYVQPLKDWETKNKRNPNFAFLIVQPSKRFDQVKKGLLQFLMGQPMQLEYITVDPIYFIYIFCYSQNKEKIKDALSRKLIEVQTVEETNQLRITNFTNIKLQQYCYSLCCNKNITRSGLQFLTLQQLKQQSKNCKQITKQNLPCLLETFIGQQESKYGQNFVVIAYRKQDSQKYAAIIKKYLNNMYTREQIFKTLQSNIVCNLDEIEIIHEIQNSNTVNNNYYRLKKICVNSCAFLGIEYNAEVIDLDSFLVYLEQLKLYYCAFMVRFYGVALQYKPQHYYYQQVPENKEKKKKQKQLHKIMLLFDYHSTTLADLINNQLILDNMQAAHITLHLLYCVNYLHTHEQPRCLGSFELSQIYWPMCIMLPYLGYSIAPHLDTDKYGYSVENDVKQVGEILGQLLYGRKYVEEGVDSDEDSVDRDEDLEELLENMTRVVKQDRWNVKKCIAELEEILFI